MNADYQNFINRKYFSALIGENLRPNERKNILVDIIMKGYISLNGAPAMGRTNKEMGI